jgi:benzoylformate decarboxylase
VAARTDELRASARKRVEHWAGEVRAARAADAVSATLVAAELRNLLPPDAVFVDEAISNRPAFVNVLRYGDPLSYFSVNGLSLGYSSGAAVGMQMALPDRRVVNVVGDGSLLYYPQALWNAVSAGTPVLFVVLNNTSYRVLKVIFDRMDGTFSSRRELLPGLDITGPDVDFVALARSLGVVAERVASPSELRPALERGLDGTSPRLVEVVLRQD